MPSRSGVTSPILRGAIDAGQLVARIALVDVADRHPVDIGIGAVDPARQRFERVADLLIAVDRRRAMAARSGAGTPPCAARDGRRGSAHSRGSALPAPWNNRAGRRRRSCRARPRCRASGGRSAARCVAGGQRRRTRARRCRSGRRCARTRAVAAVDQRRRRRSSRPFRGRRNRGRTAAIPRSGSRSRHRRTASRPVRCASGRIDSSRRGGQGIWRKKPMRLLQPRLRSSAPSGIR